MIRGVVDLWGELGNLFEGSTEDTPEIAFVNLEPEAVAAYVEYLLVEAQESTTMFVGAQTQERLTVQSVTRLHKRLRAGEVAGVVWLNLPLMPMLGLYIDGPREITISYARGEWSAISLIALFDLIQRLMMIAPSAEMLLDDRFYSEDDVQNFQRVWQACYGHLP